jgi:hypothetical protein
LADEIAFVSVVEPNGPLESQVLLLIESLRKWGGRLANARFFAVSPRLRPPLKSSTMAEFKRLGVTHIYKNYKHKYDWYAFTNKPLAIFAAREATDAKYLVWLDADVMVLDEPTEFLEHDEIDLLACPATRDLATSGPSDRFYIYWKTLCGVVGLEIEDLPWVVTKREGERVRFYLQAGVFRIRTASKMLDHYLRNFEKLMDYGLNSSTDNFFMNEQISLALAPWTSESSWRELPHSHNFSVSGNNEGNRIKALDSARIVHYHRAMSPGNRSWFLSYFQQYRPDRLAWLERIGPLSESRAPLIQRLLRRGLRALRDRRMNQFIASCHMIDTGPIPQGVRQVQT